ncbi:unnamed protein product [Prorocentrum cordatum]|uniref:Secreted protein n=1 Tax=Prorocentrum cordatum TaxID=2364126 RepID=A0ABN9X3L0_9DINO|nr:unnamed protein product [Polarella glacialis]
MHKLAHSLVVACLLVFQGRSTKRPSSSRRPGGAARKGRARLRELCGGFGFLFHNLLLLRLARTYLRSILCHLDSESIPYSNGDAAVSSQTCTSWRRRGLLAGSFSIGGVPWWPCR